MSRHRSGVLAGRARARSPAGARGPLLQEQVRPRLHGRAGERREDDHQLGAPDPQGRTRHRHLLSPARGHGLPGREHPNRLRLLRERSVDQRHVHHRRRQEAGGRVQALQGMEVPTELAPRFKFREAEVKAGRNHSRFLLHLPKRLLTADQRHGGPPRPERAEPWRRAVGHHHRVTAALEQSPGGLTAVGGRRGVVRVVFENDRRHFEIAESCIGQQRPFSAFDVDLQQVGIVQVWEHVDCGNRREIKHWICVGCRSRISLLPTEELHSPRGGCRAGPCDSPSRSNAGVADVAVEDREIVRVRFEAVYPSLGPLAQHP